MMLRKDLNARIMETAVTELSSGKESAIQLQILLQQPAEDDGIAPLDQLMSKISSSFANTISLLSSGQISAAGGEDGCGSVSSDGWKRKAAGPSRRGCYRRRKTSDSWTTLSGRMEDGYAWRKYGQKIIQHFDHPRCYFRCSYKPQGCKATKQVQTIKQNPTLFQATYFHHHTCKDSLALSGLVESDPVDSNNLISFQENIVPSNNHPPNPIDVPSPQSEYFTSNSSLDPWEDIFDLGSVGHKPEWGLLLSGSNGEEIVSDSQSFDMEFGHLGETDSFRFDES